METLILQALAGFLTRYGAVFLWKVRWISFLGSEDGVTTCEYEKKVLSRGKEPRSKPILFSKRYTIPQNLYSVAKTLKP